MRVLLGLLLLTILLQPLARAADEPITIKADTSFAGTSSVGTIPVVVTLENHGANFDGALLIGGTVENQGNRYVYPLSLPSGTKKRIVTYPTTPASSPSTFQITLESRTYRQKAILPLVGDNNTIQVGVIGDSNGGLSTVRGQRATSDGRIYNPVYARPEDAPDRAIGYEAIRYLVLTQGAERMTPAQWGAVRQWAIGGGTVVFVGGAGSTFLRTAEAADLLPVTDLHSATKNAMDVATEIVTLHDEYERIPTPIRPDEIPSRLYYPSGNAALMTGSPKPDATPRPDRDGMVVTASRPFGLGTVLFVAFDPTQQPFKNWSRVGQLWAVLLSKVPTSGRGGNVYTPPVASYGVTPTPGTPGYSPNPFLVNLPPFATIGWIFAGYFILAVPVTYFVLQRLRRLEWAWVTTPLLSVACAFGLYLFTADLYRASMSRRTTGIVSASGSEGRFQGYTELFVPHGGDYKIAVPNAETLYTSLAPEQQSYRSEPESALDILDNGAVTIPNLNVGNLSFRRIHHTESVALGGPVKAYLRRDSTGWFVGTIHNGTRFALRNVHLTRDDDATSIKIQDIPTGGWAQVTPGMASAVGSQREYVPISKIQPFRDEMNFRMSAEISGDTLGPDFGKPVAGGMVRFVTYLPITKGGE